MKFLLMMFHNVDDIDDSEKDVDDDVLLHPMIYEVVEPGSYVSLRPSPNSMGLFYVVKILEKILQRSKKLIIVDMGEQYFTVVYYKTETRKYVKFQLPKEKSVQKFMFIWERYSQQMR